MNRVTLIGNVGKDPEIRRLDNGTMVGKFSLATTESYKDANNEWQNLTEWHDIVVWRKLAEETEKTVKKGTGLYVEGKLTHRKYTDKNGIERYTTEVVAQNMHVVERPEKRETNFPSEPPPQYATDKPTQLPPTVNTNISNSAPMPSEVPPQVDEDGLPF